MHLFSWDSKSFTLSTFLQYAFKHFFTFGRILHESCSNDIEKWMLWNFKCKKSLRKKIMPWIYKCWIYFTWMNGPWKWKIVLCSWDKSLNIWRCLLRNLTWLNNWLHTVQTVICKVVNFEENAQHATSNILALISTIHTPSVWFSGIILKFEKSSFVCCPRFSLRLADRLPPNLVWTLKQAWDVS